MEKIFATTSHLPLYPHKRRTWPKYDFTIVRDRKTKENNFFIVKTLLSSTLLNINRSEKNYLSNFVIPLNNCEVAVGF